MEEKIKFPETVFLIDADFLNFVLNDIKKHFSRQLNRELPLIDLSQLITYLALDAGIPEGNKEMMTIWVHDTDTHSLAHCSPSRFKDELNNTAFKNNLGEFQFNAVSTEGLATREELFLNLLELIADSADVLKVIIIPFENQYADSVLTALKEMKNKECIQFGMSKPAHAIKHQWEILAFPLMQALGIKGNEV